MNMLDLFYKIRDDKDSNLSDTKELLAIISKNQIQLNRKNINKEVDLDLALERMGDIQHDLSNVLKNNKFRTKNINKLNKLKELVGLDFISFYLYDNEQYKTIVLFLLTLSSIDTQISDSFVRINDSLGTDIQRNAYKRKLRGLQEWAYLFKKGRFLLWKDLPNRLVPESGRTEYDTHFDNLNELFDKTFSVIEKLYDQKSFYSYLKKLYLKSGANKPRVFQLWSLQILRELITVCSDETGVKSLEKLEGLLESLGVDLGKAGFNGLLRNAKSSSMLRKEVLDTKPSIILNDLNKVLYLMNAIPPA